MRAFDDRKSAAAGRQRDRSGQAGAGTQRRVDDLLSRLVDNLVVVGLKADTDPLLNICFRICFRVCHISSCYLTTLVTTPAPTVRPPSRMAKRRPCSMAIGDCNFTLKVTVSPGITISLSAGSSTSPVTSVVRK